MNVDLSKTWTQLSDTLNAMRESDEVVVTEMVDTFEKKMKEMNGLVKDMKRWTKDKHKLELEMESVEKAIMKAKSNIEKAEHKCSDVHKYIEKLSKKNDENKENVENVMNVWNTIGLRIEKSDDIYTIKLNKISETDPNKWFAVKISLEDNHRVKVVECDPKDSLDTNLIENEFNARVAENSNPDLRHLIAFIRSNLKKRHSK
ncbi:unnamed protein product [Medioppia subpectinata]|uniref:Kinetochore protein SPC25 n=1 Tax=Medioppia subpectinata TaxID=1979941 RepID=A0A7R9KS72_9ACAR|nr:unnamed protein product [Medioppia subpectinata]CAG2107646.1 unnamed protein product [Medioppia subpectinata]